MVKQSFISGRDLFILSQAPRTTLGGRLFCRANVCRSSYWCNTFFYRTIEPLVFHICLTLIWLLAIMRRCFSLLTNSDEALQIIALWAVLFRGCGIVYSLTLHLCRCCQMSLGVTWVCSNRSQLWLTVKWATTHINNTNGFIWRMALWAVGLWDLWAVYPPLAKHWHTGKYVLIFWISFYHYQEIC